MKSVLITGANRGLGKSMLSCFEGAGWHVFATARDIDSLPARDQITRLTTDYVIKAPVAHAEHWENVRTYFHSPPELRATILKSRSSSQILSYSTMVCTRCDTICLCPDMLVPYVYGLVV